MAAIFPILDVTSCIATKWTRHMGFCITYTALLMKTWRYVKPYKKIHENENVDIFHFNRFKTLHTFLSLLEQNMHDFHLTIIVSFYNLIHL